MPFKKVALHCYSPTGGIPVCTHHGVATTAVGQEDTGARCALCQPLGLVLFTTPRNPSPV